jgi:predicted DNA-binding transcriptional regulator AlpA
MAPHATCPIASRRARRPVLAFLTIDDVAEELATSPAQIRALMKRRELPRPADRRTRSVAHRRSKLESYIHAAYEATERELERRRQNSANEPADPEQAYVSTDQDSEYRQEKGGEG